MYTQPVYAAQSEFFVLRLREKPKKNYLVNIYCLDFFCLVNIYCDRTCSSLFSKKNYSYI